MNKAVYAGRFDPITKGHMDIIRRSAELFDEVIVLILPSFGYTPFFETETRKELIRKSVAEFSNVRVDDSDGLVVDYARRVHASILIRGIHAVINFEHELQQASTNMALDDTIETVFILSRPSHAYISSSAIIEIAKSGGKIDRFVPEVIRDELNHLLTADKG